MTAEQIAEALGLLMLPAYEGGSEYYKPSRDGKTRVISVPESEFDAWLEAENKKPDKKLYKLVANYLTTDIRGLLSGELFIETNFKITAENFAEFIKMIYKNEISSKVAKMVLAEMFNTGVDPSSIVDENNWRQMSDDSELEKIIKEIIAKNPKAVEDYKSGKQNAAQFLAGQVMAKTRGTAKPDKVQKLLSELLN